MLAGPIDATVYVDVVTTDTEFAATVEAVSPDRRGLPLSSGALIGRCGRSTRPDLDGVDGAVLLPVHPLTPGVAAAARRRGRSPDEDIQVFPTFDRAPGRLAAAGHHHDGRHAAPAIRARRRRRTWSAGSTRCSATPGAASSLTVPLAPVSAFSVPCGALFPQGP